MIGFNTVEVIASRRIVRSYMRFRIINFDLTGVTVRW
jgi:hypothetical protein